MYQSQTSGSAEYSKYRSKRGEEAPIPLKSVTKLSNYKDNLYIMHNYYLLLTVFI